MTNLHCILLLLKDDIERHPVFSCSVRFRGNVFNHRMCFRVLITAVVVDEHCLSLLPDRISHLHSSVHTIRILRQSGWVNQQFLIVVVAAVDWGAWVGEVDNSGSLVALGVWFYVIVRRRVFVMWIQSSRFHPDGDVVVLMQVLLVAFRVDSVVIVWKIFVNKLDILKSVHGFWELQPRSSTAGLLERGGTDDLGNVLFYDKLGGTNQLIYLSVTLIMCQHVNVIYLWIVDHEQLWVADAMMSLEWRWRC